MEQPAIAGIEDDQLRRIRFSRGLCVFLAIALQPEKSCTCSEPPFFTSVYQSGSDGYHTFRIPALLSTPRGTLLAFCEGRKHSSADDGDIDLVVKRSADNGNSWSTMQTVHEEGGQEPITIGNPCSVVDRTNDTVWLVYCRNNDRVLVTSSKDDGATWSSPREITASVKPREWTWYATGPGVGIQLETGPHYGRLVIPCDHRQAIDGRPVMFSHVIFSDDHGQTWNLGGSVAPHTDECQVVECTDGSLIMNMRNYWGRAGRQPEKDSMRAVARSHDAGQTWSKLTFAPRLIEPVCQASLIRLDSIHAKKGDVLLFSNPASRSKRIDLTVRMSPNAGETWPTSKSLYAGPSAYSCLARLPENSVGCLFEAGEKRPYETIRFARFSVAWLTHRN